MSLTARIPTFAPTGKESRGSADLSLRSPGSPGHISSLRPELMRECALVCARRVDDALARRPQVFLVIERDDADVGHRDFGRLLQELFALGVIDSRERLVEQRIHFGIGVPPAVRLTHAFFGIE